MKMVPTYKVRWFLTYQYLWDINFTAFAKTRATKQSQHNHAKCNEK